MDGVLVLYCRPLSSCCVVARCCCVVLRGTIVLRYYVLFLLRCGVMYVLLYMRKYICSVVEVFDVIV